MLSASSTSSALWLASAVGLWLRSRDARRRRASEDFGIIVAATLTLLALIIGFSFRWPPIATISARIRGGRSQRDRDRIPARRPAAADAAKVRGLLVAYLDQRILFYVDHDEPGKRRSIGGRASCRSVYGRRSAPPAAQIRHRLRRWCWPG